MKSLALAGSSKTDKRLPYRRCRGILCVACLSPKPLLPDCHVLLPRAFCGSELAVHENCAGRNCLRVHTGWLASRPENGWHIAGCTMNTSQCQRFLRSHTHDWSAPAAQSADILL